MKKLIAYSSVAHMGFVTMGIFAATQKVFRRNLSDVVAWLDFGALFLCVGVIYDRMHTREIAAYGGWQTACRFMLPSLCSLLWRMLACREHPDL